MPVPERAGTLTPALAALLIRGRIRGEERNPLNRWLIAAYSPVVRMTVRFRKSVIVVATHFGREAGEIRKAIAARQWRKVGQLE